MASLKKGQPGTWAANRYALEGPVSRLAFFLTVIHIAGWLVKARVKSVFKPEIIPKDITAGLYNQKPV